MYFATPVSFGLWISVFWLPVSTGYQSDVARRSVYLAYNGSIHNQIPWVDELIYTPRFHSFQQKSFCAYWCDYEPSCKGFSDECDWIYCNLLTDATCITKWITPGSLIYVKNGTGAAIVTLSNRQFIHWHGNCENNTLDLQIVETWEECVAKCVFTEGCSAVVFTATSTQGPNCFLKTKICTRDEMKNIGEVQWNLYVQSSNGTVVINNSVFLEQNGYCQYGEKLVKYTENNTICAAECLKRLNCKGFAMVPTTDLGYSCELRNYVCPLSEQIYVGLGSHWTYELISLNITGLSLDKYFKPDDYNFVFGRVIFTDSGVYHNLTEEKCYAKCQEDYSCLGFNFYRQGISTAENCIHYHKLSSLIAENKLGWDSWKYNDSLIKIGYHKLKGSCESTSTSSWNDPKDCAKQCFYNNLCRSFTVFNSTLCYLSNSHCTISTNDGSATTFNKVVYKGTSEVNFNGIQFAKVSQICATAVNESVGVTTVSNCAAACISRQNCTNFLWVGHNETVKNCYIQEQFCGPTQMNLVANNSWQSFQRLNTLKETYLNEDMTSLNSNGSVIKIDEFSRHKPEYSVAVAIAIFILAATVISAIVCIRRNKKLKEMRNLERDLTDSSKEIDPIVPIFDQICSLKVDKKFELPLEQILIDRRNMKILGQGQYGIVVLGTYTPSDKIELEVAIKRTRSSWDADQYRMLFKEICLLANLGNHPNLVNMVGAVTQISRGQLYLVMEYCSNGSLRNFILKKIDINPFVNELVQNTSNEEVYKSQLVDDVQKESVTLPEQLTTSHLLSFAYQIASGMEYVASVNFIHRDLATRNILLTSHLVAKIADFGLGQQDYQFYESDKTVMLPIRWLAPEAILRHKFSIRSDMWSFGLTLGEIFSLGCVPFANCAKIDQKFAQMIAAGQIKPDRPEFASANVSQLIQNCCNPDPKLRPSFTQCKSLLSDELHLCNSAYFDHLMEILREPIPENEIVNDHAISKTRPGTNNSNNNNNKSLRMFLCTGKTKRMSACSQELEKRKLYGGKGRPLKDVRYVENELMIRTGTNPDSRL